MQQFSKTFFFIIGILVFTILLHEVKILRPLEEGLRSFLEPISKVSYSFGIKMRDETKEFKTLEACLLENQKKDEKQIEFDQKMVLLEHLQYENAELRDQLNFISSTPFAQVGADVIGKNVEPLASTLIISRGTDNGIQLGNPVVAGGGILVGKIVRVEKKSSVVRLLNDHQSTVAAMVQNGDKSIGLVEGGYGISIKMNLIPQNESIEPGDMVVTSGLEKEIPKGLLIGKVQSVEKEAYEPFQKAILSPEINFDKIFLVSVLLFQKTPEL